MIFRAALLLLFASHVIHAQYESATQQLDEIFNLYDLAGISIAVVCDGEIAYEYYNGRSDIARNIDVYRGTKYRIASISKNLTTILLMRLVDEGKIDLDADIDEYLPYSIRNPFYNEIPITCRMLASHTSTLIDGSRYGDFLNATYAANLPPPLSELLSPGGAYYEPNIYNNHPPGTYFNYSNLNFGVLSSVIENQAGERFDLFAQRILFDPLGIDGGYLPAFIEDINDLAVLYRKPGGIWTPQWDNYLGQRPSIPELIGYNPGTNGLFFSPQGGVRCSAYDLARIMIMLLQGGTLDDVTILSPESREQMDTPAWTYNGTNGNNYWGLFRSWGLGTHITTNTPQNDIVFGDHIMYGHPGEAYGLISDMYYNTAKKFGIVFMTNGSGVGYGFSNTAFYNLEDDVFSIIYEEVIQPCLETSTTVSEPVMDGKAFRIFPNPLRDELNISGETERINAVSVRDIDGKKHHLQLTGQKVNTSQLPPGSYILEVLLTGGVREFHTFVKQ